MCVEKLGVLLSVFIKELESLNVMATDATLLMPEECKILGDVVAELS